MDTPLAWAAKYGSGIRSFASGTEVFGSRLKRRVWSAGGAGLLDADGAGQDYPYIAPYSRKTCGIGPLTSQMPRVLRDKKRATVLLVPGLWMPAFSLLIQGKRIERCGFHVEAFSYASVLALMTTHAGALAARVAALEVDTIHLVGHSMGGLVILKTLAEYRDPRISRVVLLGPPFHGSAAGRALGSIALGRLLLGESHALWTQEEQVPAPRDVEVGVIAGTRPAGLGALLGVLDRPHDGVLMVSETRIPGMNDHITLKVSHAEMLFAPSVGRQVCAFLKNGRFARACRESKEGAP